jgi:hypothetical protein
MGRFRTGFLIGRREKRLLQVKVKRKIAAAFPCSGFRIKRVHFSPLAGTTMATSISPVAPTYSPLIQPQTQAQPQQIRHNISTTLRRSMALLAPNARGSLKRASKVTIIAAEDSGIGHSIAVLFAADGSGVAVVRLPRGK